MDYILQPLRSATAQIIFAMITVFCIFLTLIFFQTQLGITINIRDPYSMIYFVVYSIAFNLVIPLLVSYFIFNESPRNLGLRKPEWSLVNQLITVISLILLLLAAHKMAEFKAVKIFYSMKGMSLFDFLFIHLVDAPPYYFAEEFFFRGFLFLRLHRKLGWHSYWITELIFAFAHLGKPWQEVVISFPAGIVLNYLALRTKSIYPPLLVHYLVGLYVNVLINYYY